MKIPKTLKDKLSEGKVIPFVGAGVSMAVKEKGTANRLFPSWKELLERAANQLDAEQNTDDAVLVRSFLKIRKPKYLEAASHASEVLGPKWFSFLKEQLDHRRDQADDESLRLAEAIWALGSLLLITTNYDRVLHWTRPQREDLSIWDIGNPVEQAKAWSEGVKRPTVWHLHGSINNAADLILTPDGYERLYPGAGAVKGRFQAALKSLEICMATRTFLFIGFSMDDQQFGLQLQANDDIFQHATGPHYVLAHKDSADLIRAQKLPVEIIEFEAYGEPLLNLVAELGKNSAPIRSDDVRLRDNVSAPSVVSYDPRNNVFHVPFRPKGDQVVGRKETLELVREELTNGTRAAIGHTAALVGLGGLGKTQLAVEYAYRYKQDYPNGVIWLTADQDIDAQLTGLAEKAKWVAPESEHKYKLEIALHRLRTWSDCLIIFDNLETIAAIEKYLPEPQANPHILVTSRTEQPGFTPIPIELLDSDLSLKLLLQEAGRRQYPVGDAEENAAREIANTLDGLPLALELAGAYVRYRRLGWQQYRDHLKGNIKAALPGKFLEGSFTKHDQDLYSTLKINEEVFSEEPRLRDILDLLAWSGSAPMGMSLMCALLDVHKPAELTSALGLATAIRLLQKSVGIDSYSIHRLLAEMRREEVPLAGREEWIKEICKRIGDWFEQRKGRFENLPVLEAEIDHLRMWQQNALDHAQEHAIRLTWLQAYPPLHRGRYKETEEWVMKASELLKQFQVKDSKLEELEANLLEDHGFCLYQFGDYTRALEYHEKSLEIRLKLFGEHHRDTAQSLNSVGNTYAIIGNKERALEHHEKSLKIRQELFGELHPDTAQSFYNIGFTYGKMGQNKLALVQYEKSLKIRQELFGELHPDTAQSLNSVGNTYAIVGNKERALEYIEKALKLRRELLGDLHPDTILSFTNLAYTLFFLGRESEALQVVDEILPNIPKDHLRYDMLRYCRQVIVSKLQGSSSQST